MDKIQTGVLVVFVAAVIAVASGCGGDEGSDTQPGSEGQSAGDRSAQTSTLSDQRPTELSAAHILIMHTGSDRAPPEITRSKEEALALVQEVANNAKADGADFAALAKEHSDCPSAAEGGNLGNFSPGQMVEEFTEATMKLAIGEVSDPVETQFGYHIIRRQEIQVIQKASAKHVLVQYADSMRAGPSITRTKEEAYARIQECLTKYEEGENFEDLAREYSDGPTGPDGGDLGEFEQGMMAPAFDEAVFACEVGKVTDIVETPFGYHIIYRYK
jgi:parvulin-like peptidyl-prolyl isomerase